MVASPDVVNTALAADEELVDIRCGLPARIVGTHIAFLVTAEPHGVALDSFRAILVPGTGDLITWRIRESGFDMVPSGEVPATIHDGFFFAMDTYREYQYLNELWASEQTPWKVWAE